MDVHHAAVTVVQPIAVAGGNGKRVVGAGALPLELEDEGAASMSSGVVRTVAPSWMLVSSPMMTGAPSPGVCFAFF